ncbi:hypothetical protein G5B40_17260 [Pikeienuella piscinae]|uniref:Pycsar effector protein domain-containing protein n=1 Tax=Pikeienuella piscinae TaxID=2748098 RepID=A0A7L5C0W8_9RHOB|nr:hypothetical protein [Pikeienuella piscinae]QIE57033.1 hypothetical protein G5B40_17260 [Pikeienuella piscinae]
MIDTRIEDLPLDRDVSSHEGISIDQTARVRLAYLLGQNSALVAQTQFADAKAGALLAIVGLLATRGPGASLDPTVVNTESILVISLHAAALICCVIVLFPRYAGRPLRAKLAASERFSWPALTADGMNSDLYADFMRGAQVSQLVISIARSNQAQAQILLRKFNWLRAAFGIAMADFFFIAARAAYGSA